MGPRGQRVNHVTEELHGEKIDIIKYYDDPAQFIAAALAPAEVDSVTLAPEGKACRVRVPDHQLSLAIGREGQNARLAARLTGYKIDIKPRSFEEAAETAENPDAENADETEVTEVAENPEAAEVAELETAEAMENPDTDAAEVADAESTDEAETEENPDAPENIDTEDGGI